MRKQDEALIIIDIQNDFCPGGALAIPEGDAIVPGVNALMSEFQTVVLTQDWHPNGHSSLVVEVPLVRLWIRGRSVLGRVIGTSRRTPAIEVASS